MAGAVQVLMAAVASIGFAILFNIQGRKLALCLLGGSLGWVIYLAAGLVLPGEAMQTLVAAMAVTFLAEALARWEKAPVTAFLVPSLIPLLPGGYLYYTMECLLHEATRSYFSDNALRTASIAGAIALGIFIATSFSKLPPLVRAEIRRKKEG